MDETESRALIDQTALTLGVTNLLFRSTGERTEVERGIDTLLQFSMAESQTAPADKQLESFIANVARRVDAGEPFEGFAPILEMICRAYNPGWLLLALAHEEPIGPGP